MVLGDHQRDARVPSDPDELFGLGHGAGDRLLHEDVLRVSGGEQDVFEVYVVWGNEVDGVDARVAGRLLVAGEESHAAVPVIEVARLLNVTAGEEEVDALQGAASIAQDVLGVLSQAGYTQRQGHAVTLLTQSSPRRGS